MINQIIDLLWSQNFNWKVPRIIRSLTTNRRNLKAHDSLWRSTPPGARSMYNFEQSCRIGRISILPYRGDPSCFWRVVILRASEKGSKSSLKYFYSGRNPNNFSGGYCPRNSCSRTCSTPPKVFRSSPKDYTLATGLFQPMSFPQVPFIYSVTKLFQKWHYSLPLWLGAWKYGSYDGFVTRTYVQIMNNS